MNSKRPEKIYLCKEVIVMERKKVSMIVKLAVVGLTMAALLVSHVALAQKTFRGITLRVAIVHTEDSEYLASHLAPMLEAESGIKLIVDQIPYDELNAKQLMDWVGAKNYDIINPCTEWSHQYMPFAVPLNKYIGDPNYPDPELNDIIPGVWKVWKPTENIYWFPYQPDSRVFYYRKDLIEEAGLTPPKTWNELLSAVKKLNVEGLRYGFAFPGRRGLSMNLAWIPFLFSAGGDLFDENQKPVLNSKAGVDSLEFLLDLFNYGPPDISAFGEFEHYGAAKRGFTATGVEASGITQAFESVDSLVRGKIVTDLYPVKSLSIPRSATAIMGGWALGAADYSKNKDAAAWAVLWLTSREVITDWQIHGRQHASRLSMAKNPKLLAVNPHVATIVETLNGAKMFFEGPEAPELEQILLLRLSQAIAKELSPKEALDVAAKEFEETLAKAGYYK